MNPHPPQVSDLLPAIRRARIDRLNIYEISETELQMLERGSPESLFLNFAIFLLSSASSLLVALLTTKIVAVHGFTARKAELMVWVDRGSMR